MKSQLYRLRNLCSRDIDFEKVVVELRKRCINSEYPADLVTEVLSSSTTLIRYITKEQQLEGNNNMQNIRIVTLAGTDYGKEFTKFAMRMNPLIKTAGINIQIVNQLHPQLVDCYFTTMILR